MEEQTVPASTRKPIRWLPIYTLFAAVIFILVAGLLATKLLPQSTGADFLEGQVKDEVVIAETDKISGRYPNNNYDVVSLAFNNASFEGLTVLKEGRVQPALAENWTNPDDLTWRVKLRKAKFHDGSELKASDVKYTIDEAKKDRNWVSNFIASRIDTVTVIDELTVELKTANPDPTLLQWMVFLFILSEDQVKRDGLEGAVGTGPYKITSFTDEGAQLTAFENYWRGVPKVKKVTYAYYEDREAQIKSLVDGNSDLAFSTSKEFQEKLGENSNFRILRGRMSDGTYIGYDTNSQENNPFSNLKVRQAMFLGLDAQKTLEASGREGLVLTQISSPDLTGFNNTLTRPKVDIEAAKKLLTEAGYPNGFSATLDVEDLSVEIAESIKKQLALIGINIEVNSSDFNNFIERLTSGQSSFYVFAYVPDTLDALDLVSGFVHTPDDSGRGGLNFSSYSNKEIDSLLDEAALEFDTAERGKLVANAQKEIMEDLPYIPLFTRTGFFAVRETVSFTPAPFGYIFPSELSGREKVSEEK